MLGADIETVETRKQTFCGKKKHKKESKRTASGQMKRYEKMKNINTKHKLLELKTEYFYNTFFDFLHKWF